MRRAAANAGWLDYSHSIGLNKPSRRCKIPRRNEWMVVLLKYVPLPKCIRAYTSAKLNASSGKSIVGIN